MYIYIYIYIYIYVSGSCCLTSDGLIFAEERYFRGNAAFPVNRIRSDLEVDNEEHQNENISKRELGFRNILLYFIAFYILTFNIYTYICLK